MKVEIYPLDRVELGGKSVSFGMKRTNDVQNTGLRLALVWTGIIPEIK